MVYLCFTDVGIWASLGKAGLRKSRTTLGEIVRLHNCAVADKGSIGEYLTSTTGSWAKQGLQKLHTTSGEILGLHNYAVADKGSIDDGQCRD